MARSLFIVLCAVLALTASAQLRGKNNAASRSSSLTLRGTPSASEVAMVFDIDGVFKQGDRVCLEGQIAIRKVLNAGMPFIFLTNGGAGATEDQYMQSLNKKLNTANSELCWPNKENEKLLELRGKLRPVQIGSEHLLLSYSPWNRTLPALADKPVLVIGSSDSVHVANQYGFSKAVHISEYARQHPDMDPFNKAGSSMAPYCPNVFGDLCDWDPEKHACRLPTTPATDSEPFGGIFAYSDPIHMGQVLQIGSDILLSSRPTEVEYEQEQVPIYFAATDLIFKSTFAFSRFGLGHVMVALQAVYEARLRSVGATEEQIQERLKNWHHFGKPNLPAYLYAEKRVHDLSPKTVKHFVMVGDNPNTDIEGAHRADAHASEVGTAGWSGIVLRTGVFKDGDNPNDPVYIANDVNDAMDWVLGHVAAI